MEYDPSRESLRQDIIDRADKLLSTEEYREDSPGFSERGIKREMVSMFGKRMFRRVFLPTENFDEEIVVVERSVKMFGRTRRTRMSVSSMSGPGGDGRGGYRFDWGYKVLDDPEVIEHAAHLECVLSEDIEERTLATNELRRIGHGKVQSSF